MNEVTETHTRLMRWDLVIDHSRTWWSKDSPRTAARAFDEGWFGAMSEKRVESLARNLAFRFDAFPHGLPALRAVDLSPAARSLVCHWHVQLTDPLYRDFTGDFLPQRRTTNPTLRRETVADWVDQQQPGRWGTASRVQFASKLLGCAKAVGLLQGTRGVRTLTMPTVDDTALTYLLYLLRPVRIASRLDDNPYLRSVLHPDDIAARLQRVPALGYRAGLAEFEWAHPDLQTWAAA